MAINMGYKQFLEFDIRKDPETVYVRFVRYAERFKNNHLKAYKITDKVQQQSLLLELIGEATQSHSIGGLCSIEFGNRTKSNSPKRKKTKRTQSNVRISNSWFM